MINKGAYMRRQCINALMICLIIGALQTPVIPVQIFTQVCITAAWALRKENYDSEA